MDNMDKINVNILLSNNKDNNKNVFIDSYFYISGRVIDNFIPVPSKTTEKEDYE